MTPEATLPLSRPPAEWIADRIPVFAPRSAAERAADRYDRDFGVADLYTGMAYGRLVFGEEGGEALYRAIQTLLPRTTRSVLDVGCGAGRVLYDAAPEMPAAHVTGVDLSYHMCLRAHQILRGGEPIPLPAWEFRGRPDAVFQHARSLPNVTIAQGSALDLPFLPMSFDAVNATLLLCRLPDPERGLTEMVRVLKPGGTLLLATPLGFNAPEHWRRFAPEGAMRDLLAAFGLRVQEWIEHLPYREMIDARGNMHEWNVRIVAATQIL
jgi:SAM-dependent methyltransferase